MWEKPSRLPAMPAVLSCDTKKFAVLMAAMIGVGTTALTPIFEAAAREETTKISVNRRGYMVLGGGKIPAEGVQMHPFSFSQRGCCITENDTNADAANHQ